MSITSPIAVPTDQEVLSAIDGCYDESVNFLKRIVSIDSTLEKGEGEVQSVIYKHLQQVLNATPVVDSSSNKRKRDDGRFEIEQIPVRLDQIKGKKGFSPVDWNYDHNKFNVVARFHSSSGEEDKANDPRALLLQGHVDVVPADESDGWSSPPFSPTIKNGRMYGRGSGDMKAGVVSMIYAMVALKRLGYVPMGNIAICTVIEEECTGNGALATSLETIFPLNTDHTKTAVIIPEPFPFITTAQLGVLWFTAKVTGKPCHVLQTSAGSNAIEGAYQLYNDLRKLEEAYNFPIHSAFKGIQHPVNFNLGKIKGGNWASSVPSSCTFEVRCGFFPGVEIDKVKRDIEKTLADSSERFGLGLQVTYNGFNADGAVLLPEYVDGLESSSPGEASLQRKFVETLQKCHKLASSTTQNLQLKPITCTCDCRFYSSVFQDSEKVVVTCLGPEANSIHGVDESVNLKSMKNTTATIALFIKEWLGLSRIDQ